MSSITANQAAAAFLYFNSNDPEKDNLSNFSNLKLDKMLYYAQAYRLGMDGCKLFDDNIRAEYKGPVIEKMDYKNISKSIKNIPEETLKFLFVIYDSFKEYTGDQLSNMTHKEGEPWVYINKEYKGNLDSKPIIPINLIFTIFDKRVKNCVT